jgi:hypothetical protein
LLQNRGSQIMMRLLQWIFFTVLISFTPFAVVAIILIGRGRTFSASALWPHGELLIVSTTLAADAMGDLFNHSSPGDLLRIMAGGGFLLVVIVTVVWYTILQLETDYPVWMISKGSLAIFGFVVTTGACIKIFARKE